MLGLLAEKQCLRSLLTGAYDRMPAGIVSDFMLQEFVAVPPDMGVFELAELFIKEAIRRFMVVEDGVVSHLEIEPSPAAVSVSGADSMLAKL